MIILEIILWMALFVLIGILATYPMLLALLVALTWYEYKKLPDNDDGNSSQNSDTEN